MRILSRTAGIIFFLFVMVVGGLVVWPLWPVAEDQFGTAPYRDWLIQNRTVLYVDMEEPGFSFPENVYDARFIMLSEVHGYRAVQAIDLSLITHLTYHGPARSYLAELGPDQAMAFNYYLATGDAAPAEAVFANWAAHSTQWGNREFFEKLVQLRALNATLPVERQVWFIGVDRPSRLDALADAIVNAQGATQSGFSSYVEVQALNSELLSAGLARGEDVTRYGHILANIELVNGYASEVDRNFYGLWGLYHGSKATVNGTDPLSRRLNAAGGTFENSVITISTICIDGCFNMMPARMLPGFVQGSNNELFVDLPLGYDDVYLQRVRGVNDLAAASAGDSIVMFPVSGADSPYNSGPRLRDVSGYLTLLQKFEYGGPAAEVSDYVIVIRRSAPLTPFQGEAYDPTGGDAALAGISAVENALR